MRILKYIYYLIWWFLKYKFNSRAWRYFIKWKKFNELEDLA